MATQDYSKSGVMIIKTIKALKGHTLTGLSVSEVAESLGTSATNATRYLNALVSEEFVTKLRNGRYALSVEFSHIAHVTLADLTKSRNEIDEMLQQITTGRN